MLHLPSRPRRADVAVFALCVLMLGVAWFQPLPLRSLLSSPQQGSTVVGAALGGAIVMSGAGWLAGRRERQSRLQVLASLASIVVPAFRYAKTVEVFLECAIRLQASSASAKDVRSTIQFARKEARRLGIVTYAMDDRIATLRPLFFQFGYVGALAYGALSLVGDQLRTSVARVPWRRCLDCPDAIVLGLAQLQKQNCHVTQNVTDALAMLQSVTDATLEGLRD